MHCLLFARGIIALFVSLLALVSSQASARDNDSGIPWAKVGDWGIFIDTSVSGCFMLGSWTQGEMLRIGIDNNKKNGYLMIHNDKWRSVEVGKEYRLRFQFDGESRWTGVFTGVKIGKITVLESTFTSGKFLREFASKQSLTIHYNDKLVTWLPLTGSFAAMGSVVQCQSKVDAVAAGKDDPFSKQDAQPLDIRRTDPFSGGGVRRASDPFSQ